MFAARPYRAVEKASILWAIFGKVLATTHYPQILRTEKELEAEMATNGKHLCAGDALISAMTELVDEKSGFDWQALISSLQRTDIPSIAQQSDFIKAVQALRDHRKIDTDEATFLISHSVEFIVEFRLVNEYSAINSSTDLGAFDRTRDEFIVATFEKYGETNLAQKFRHDPGGLQKIRAQGQLKFQARNFPKT
jgi:hypothetical protein